YEVFVGPSLCGQAPSTIEIPPTTSHAARQTIEWTPDGKSLVFTDTTVEPPCLAAVDIESGDKVRLTAPPPKIQGDYNARISPDGKSLAFARLYATGVFDFEMIGFPPKPSETPAPMLKGVSNRYIAIAWTADSREWIVSDRFGGVK